MMKDYKILSVDKKHFLVIVLSVDNVTSYLQALHEDIARINADICELYVDLILRNGLSNRFFKISVKNGTFVDDAITRCKAPERISDMSNSFFNMHKEYIHKSIMPSCQKNEYIKQLSNTMK